MWPARAVFMLFLPTERSQGYRHIATRGHSQDVLCNSELSAHTHTHTVKYALSISEVCIAGSPGCRCGVSVTAVLKPNYICMRLRNKGSLVRYRFTNETGTPWQTLKCMCAVTYLLVIYHTVGCRYLTRPSSFMNRPVQKRARCSKQWQALKCVYRPTVTNCSLANRLLCSDLSLRQSGRWAVGNVDICSSCKWSASPLLQIPGICLPDISIHGVYSSPARFSAALSMHSSDFKGHCESRITLCPKKPQVYWTFCHDDSRADGCIHVRLCHVVYAPPPPQSFITRWLICTVAVEKADEDGGLLAVWFKLHKSAKPSPRARSEEDRDLRRRNSKIKENALSETE